MPDIIKNKDFDYIFRPSGCASCGGRCCTGESGNIFVTPQEIEAIVKLLAITKHEFIENYLRKVGYKYSLKERKIEDSYDCIFFNRTIMGCDIYTARPMQCQTFPFWEYFKTHIDELKIECPAVVFEND
jgi:Fe-S-cluster containining protein